MARLWYKDKEFLAYLAGFIDGEGTISLSKRRRGIYGTFSYTPYVSIVNTNYEVLSYFQQRLSEGQLYTNIKNSKGHLGKKDVHKLYFSHKKAKILLEALLPYLIVKRKQAELLLEMPSLNTSFSREKNTLLKSTQTGIYNQLKAIHGRVVV